MSRTLDVYLKDNFVGTLTQNPSGTLTFSYDETYLNAAKIAISVSLPLRAQPFEDHEARAFFSGLLPDESVKQRLANYLGLSENNIFALLEAIGRDCAGAVALYPHGMKPSAETYQTETLDDAQLTEILELIKHRPMLAGDEGCRLSLAGAQDKLAVGFKDGKVLLMKGGSPTTHIIKPVIDRLQDTAHNELFCMRLAKEVGLQVPQASLCYVGNVPYYLVERYDRIVHADGAIERIHQEDFCQALGFAPEMKYEIEGGPGITECRYLISEYVAQPATDEIKFLNRVIFNYLIGNSDAHGKNFSLLYREAKPELSPAYDIISTIIYPDISRKMAMKIGGKYQPDEVYLRHFGKLVADTKTARSAMDKQVQKMTNGILEKALRLKESLAKETGSSPVFDDIIAVIKRRKLQLQE